MRNAFELSLLDLFKRVQQHCKASLREIRGHLHSCAGELVQLKAT